jgi:hypothetical protein
MAAEANLTQGYHERYYATTLTEKGRPESIYGSLAENEFTIAGHRASIRSPEVFHRIPAAAPHLDSRLPSPAVHAAFVPKR